MEIKVGDAILARSSALVCGGHCEWRDPEKFKFTAEDDNWYWLGERSVIKYASKDHFTLVTVMAIVRFPSEAHNLNHFHVMMPDGQIVSVFDDHENGFWIEVGSSDKRTSNYTNALLEWYHYGLDARKIINV